jgi:outer membrane lipoprotein-sorting protein
LDTVIEQLDSSTGITAHFTLQGEADSGLFMQGSIKMQGKKFSIHTQDLTTWYDGKTMWTYAASIGEVNITTPTPQELAEVNPYLILDNYKHSFVVKELNSTQRGERLFHLTPTKRNTSINHIILTIATQEMAPIAFEITDNNNNTILVNITDYNNKAHLPASAFTFDKTLYPHADIIDLR